MGYRTHYDLSVIDEDELHKNNNSEYRRFVLFLDNSKVTNPKDEDEFQKFQVGSKPDECIEIPVEWLYDFWKKEGEPCKWYGNEKDMKLVSQQFPTLIFKLEGEGEEPGDLWKKYFKNGMMQRCYAKITYDDFDEGKLE